VPRRSHIRHMTETTQETPAKPAEPPEPAAAKPWPKEIGGPPGPEPTRYGDWQYKGRCTDF
jgi:hypothetical protein